MKEQGQQIAGFSHTAARSAGLPSLANVKAKKSQFVNMGWSLLTLTLGAQVVRQKYQHRGDAAELEDCKKELESIRERFDSDSWKKEAFEVLEIDEEKGKVLATIIRKIIDPTPLLLEPSTIEEPANDKIHSNDTRVVGQQATGAVDGIPEKSDTRKAAMY